MNHMRQILIATCLPYRSGMAFRFLTDAALYVVLHEYSASTFRLVIYMHIHVVNYRAYMIPPQYMRKYHNSHCNRIPP